MSKDALEQVRETFRIRRGLMTMPIAMFLFPQILICAFLFVVIVSKKTPALLFQRWEVWVLAINLFLVVPAGCFVIQKFYSRRNTILFKGSSLVQTQFLKPYELRLTPDTKLAVYLYSDGSFLLREFDQERMYVKRKEKAILFGQVHDLNLAEMNRLLTTIRPHLELTTGLLQLFSSSRFYNKSFSIEEEYWQNVLGEISFKGVVKAPSLMFFRLLMLCGIGVFMNAGITGLLTRHPAKAAEIGVYTSLLLVALMMAIGTLWRAERVEALLGSEGVGVQTVRGIRRALPYRLLGDLTYTVTESNGKTLATITAQPGPEEFKAIVIIESPEHLAQLDQAIQDAQSKLGTPTVKENQR